MEGRMSVSKALSIFGLSTLPNDADGIRSLTRRLLLNAHPDTCRDTDKKSSHTVQDIKDASFVLRANTRKMCLHVAPWITGDEARCRQTIREAEAIEMRDMWVTVAVRAIISGLAEEHAIPVVGNPSYLKKNGAVCINGRWMVRTRKALFALVQCVHPVVRHIVFMECNWDRWASEGCIQRSPDTPIHPFVDMPGSKCMH